MKMDTHIINRIFYSNIQNKRHYRIRRKGFLIGLFKEFKKVFSFKINNNVFKDEASLILCNDFYIDKSAFKNIVNKGNLRSEDSIDFNFEEYLCYLTFLVNESLRLKLANYILKRIEKKIANYSFKIMVVSFPTTVDYFIAIILKSKGCKIFTFQHGVYRPYHYKSNYFEDEIADYCLVWSKMYKECYMRNGIGEERIKIVHPYFSVTSSFSKEKSTKALYLGQNLYQVSDNIKAEYNSNLLSLIKYLQRKNILLYYKPHPRENIKISLEKSVKEKMIILDKKKLLSDLFHDYNYAFSITSTSLIQALCEGLYCYQIKIDFGIPSIDFTKYTSILDINAFYQEEKAEKFFIDPYFLNITKNPKLKNTKIIRDLIEK